MSGHDPATLRERMQTVMSELSLWFGYNRLSLNLKESKFMIFGTDGQIDKIGDITLNVGNNSLD